MSGNRTDPAIHPMSQTPAACAPPAALYARPFSCLRPAFVAFLLLSVSAAPGLIQADTGMSPAPTASSETGGRILRVGPGREFAKPSDAAAVARDGDTVEIDAGSYPGDAAVWRANGLHIRGVGGLARLPAAGAHAEGKAIWVIKGNAVTVESIAFSGARVPHGNGAGIRAEGAGLRISRSLFHDNQNGILTRDTPDGDILIEHSEFAGNGAGDGLTHNMYIGKVRSFTLRHSYIHGARIGHQVKSRAYRSNVLYNRIMDGADGNSSYLLDFPNGGQVMVLGNELQQGPRAVNFTLVSYGAEGLAHKTNTLLVVNNTLVNDRPAGGRFFAIAPGTESATLANNLLIGRATALGHGAATLAGNVIGSPADVRDITTFDYRLTPASAAIDAGITSSAAGVALPVPDQEYEHPARGRARIKDGRIDAGAREFGS
jgi:hypothetical protein